MQADLLTPAPNEIFELRHKLGLAIPEFCNLLGLNSSSEEQVVLWESGETKPTKDRMNTIRNLEKSMAIVQGKAPFKKSEFSEDQFSFIDLFAGIGGIRLPFQNQGGRCVFSSEIDKFAQKTYFTNFGDYPHGDITKIPSSNIPDHDLLLGGFPCQAFSQAGLKKGFNDTRGTMFFEIQRILAEKRPKMFLLENVKQLKGHDKGRTLQTILSILRGEHDQALPDDIPMSDDARTALSKKLNYWVDFVVLKAVDFGIPQNRERIYLVGFDKDYFGDVDFNSVFRFPTPPKLDKAVRVGNILEADDDKTAAFTISDRLWGSHQKRKNDHKTKGNGFGYSIVNAESSHTNTISARYYKDGSEALVDQSHLGKNPRMLTPRECARLQGFPEEFIIDAVSKGQIYKQFGNSVCQTVVTAIAKEMIATFKNLQASCNKT